MKDHYPFPESFVWGVATSAYQVEGAADEDGRGPSIWDAFSHTPGRVAMDHSGDVSVDQYHRYKEDIQLMKWLGVKAYRFSVSWPRVFPKGYGRVNEKGLAYYDRLADELLANDIEPWVCLFHWDLPQTLEDELGGWQSRETAEHFSQYAAAVTARLSDRVRHFFTVNEFNNIADAGYGGGVFAPGKHLSPKDLNQVRHWVVLAHGLGVQAIRANARQSVMVGIAENPSIPVPVMETQEHIAAARAAMRENNAHFLTAVMEGRYLDSYLETQGGDAPEFTAEDMKAIGSAMDFVGLNAYTPRYVRAAEDKPGGFEMLPPPESHPRIADLDWFCLGPEVLYWAPRLAKEVWDVDHVVISENGCMAADKATPEGRINDTDRLMYLRNHLVHAHRAVSEGWPLKGYFLWSLLDNFEWARGYTCRCGICYVNYRTLQRTPKLSGEFYREVIARNAVV